MDERILMLIEETGCERGEAELALQLSNYDFEKSIRTIKTALKNIAIVKGKFINYEQNLYGIFILIFNTQLENIIRAITAVSYNPIIYEIDLHTDWYTIEKSIYNFRLLEGSMPNLTREIELYFSKELSSRKDKVYSALLNKSEREIYAILTSDFPVSFSQFQVNMEEINLAEYQQENQEVQRKDLNEIQIESKQLYLEAKLKEDKKGKKVKSLSKGEIVMAQIADEREIAKYLSRLLSSEETDFLPVRIENIEKSKNSISIKLYFAPGIIGLVKTSPKTRIKVIEENKKPLLKRILGMK